MSTYSRSPDEEWVHYLMGPINGQTDEVCNDWRKSYAEEIALRQSKDKTIPSNIVILDPMRRDYRGKEHLPGIADRISYHDEVDVVRAHICVAYVPFPSVGTAMEIDRAYSFHRHIIIINQQKHPSPWLVKRASEFWSNELEAAEAAIAYMRQHTIGCW